MALKIIDESAEDLIFFGDDDDVPPKESTDGEKATAEGLAREFSSDSSGDCHGQSSAVAELIKSQGSASDSTSSGFISGDSPFSETRIPEFETPTAKFSNKPYYSAFNGASVAQRRGPEIGFDFTSSPFAIWHRECPQCSSRLLDFGSHSQHSSRVRALAASLTDGQFFNRLIVDQSPSNGECCATFSTRPVQFQEWLRMVDVEAEMSEEVPEFAARALCTEFPGLSYIDSHCHLDLLFQKEGHTGTYAAYRELRKNTWAKCYEGCITNFCFPESFTADGQWKYVLREPGVYATFGCHPHQADRYDDELEGIIMERLFEEKVIALGEMGLDYSRNNHIDHEIQKHAFRQQLRLAVDNRKPIVIHCRDAEEDCFEIMTQIVPHDHPIHRHCFTARYEDAERLINTFSNLKIGLTNFVNTAYSSPFSEIVRRFPLDRILIETDSPYFLPQMYKNPECNSMQWCHPGLGFLVAAKLAHERNLPVPDVLRQIRQNTREVYGI